MGFKWKDSYSCNIEEIDNQHQKLFEIGSRLYDLASLSDQYDHYDQIMKILDELREYTIYHFDYEENLMQEYGYSDYEIHKLEHNFFVRKIQRLERKDIDGQQKEALLEIIEFVADWVASHILKTDLNYKEFFNTKGLY